MAREKIDNWKATSLKPFNFHHSRYLDANDDPSTSFLVRTPAELVDESARIPKGLKIHRCRPPLRSTIQATRNAREPDRVINARASIRAKRPWIWPILIRERSIRQGVQDGEFPCVERKERERRGKRRRQKERKGKRKKNETLSKSRRGNRYQCVLFPLANLLAASSAQYVHESAASREKLIARY